MDNRKYNGLLKANESLQSEVKKLEALVSQQGSKIDLCISFIDQIAHLHPVIFEKFQLALQEIER